MADLPRHLDPRTLASLDGLKLRARKIVEGYMAGLHRSPLRGFSVEFSEHRDYTAGDDTRHLDWKLFARTDKFYVKQYEDETNLICYLVLDVSASMGYQGPQAAFSKLEYVRCLAAALSWLVLGQQDAVGLATVSDRVDELVRPASHASQWDVLLELLERTAEAGATGIGEALHDLAERFSRRGIVFIFSDLLSDPEDVLAGLRHLAHRRHDVVVLEVLDPAELEFPFQHFSQFEGMEQEGTLLADPHAIRQAYLAELARGRTELKEGLRQLGMDLFHVRTDQPLDRVLRDLLASRRNRVGVS